jgi:hypothetical protein
MQLRETAPSANMSRSLPTATLAAQAHGAEGQCLLERNKDDFDTKTKFRLNTANSSTRD